jgi:hypothetical protein
MRKMLPRRKTTIVALVAISLALVAISTFFQIVQERLPIVFTPSILVILNLRRRDPCLVKSQLCPLVYFL